MITLICGPMFSGKSTVLFQRLEKYLFSKKKILLIRAKKDTRGYFTHSNGVDIEKLQEKYKGILDVIYQTKLEQSDVDEIKQKDYKAIFIDEFFLIKNSSLFCFLNEPNVNIYFSGLIATSECNLFEETIKILPYCDKIKKLNSVCMNCGSDVANYSFYNKGIKTQKIAVGDREYDCLCQQCYNMKMKQKMEVSN